MNPFKISYSSPINLKSIWSWIYWEYVYASSKKEAVEKCNYDSSRFAVTNAMPVKKFRKYYGV